MRYLYSFLFYLILPFVFLRLWRRSRALPDYGKRVRERFGFYPFALEKCIWVHAVSVGETLASVPLVKALQKAYPQYRILMTTMTPTGAERVQAAFGDTVQHAYIPYDLPDAVHRFLNHTKPVISIIMETELWPNMFAACKQKNIPVCLLNARLSEKSARGYARIASLTKEMLSAIHVIGANGETDAKRFIELGAQPNQVVVTGNIKFDIEIADDILQQSLELRKELGNQRFIWIAASTHEGEDEIILTAHQKIRAQHPDALLILVPRHPERFNTVATLAESMLTIARRSKQEKCSAETAVYLGDTMGELLMLYAVSDVAFVGGSFVAVGGHNMLEPAAFGKPIVTGPHLFNFAEIAGLFESANALIKVSDSDALADSILMFMQDAAKRAQIGVNAKAVADKNRGALKKDLEIIAEVMSR